MESHGGDVELLGLEDGIARIRLEGSCDGCPASASTLELAIKQALDEAAPDLEGLVVEGAVEAPQTALGDGATELPVVTGRAREPRRAAVVVRPRRRRRRRGGRASRRRGGGRRADRRPGRRQPARLPRRAAPAAASPLADGALSGDILACRSLRAPLLPAAGGPLARRRPPAARAGAAARPRGRHRAGCARGMSEALDRQVAGPAQRRARRRACAGSLAAGAGAALRTGPRPRLPARAVRPLRQRGSARPPPPAPPDRAAHPLRLRELLRAALGRPGAAADRDPRRLARRLRARRRALGSVRHPDRARLLHRSTASPAGSSPSTRARPGPPSPSSTSTPGRSCAAANPVLTASSPTSRR